MIKNILIKFKTINKVAKANKTKEYPWKVVLIVDEKNMDPDLHKLNFPVVERRANK